MEKIKIKDLEPIFNKYKKLLGFKDYNIEIAVADKFFVIKSKDKKIRQCESGYEGKVNREGDKDYVITLDRNNLTEKNIENVIKHELLHIFFWKMLAFSEIAGELSGSSLKKKRNLVNNVGIEEHKIIEKLVKIL